MSLIALLNPSVPQKTHHQQEIPGDWCHVAVKKLDSRGRRIEGVFQYVMENSTGDLYGLQDSEGRAPSRCITSFKSAGIWLGVSPYMICMIGWRFINFFADLFEAVVKWPSCFVSDFQNKSLWIALLNGCIRPTSEILFSIAENVSRAVAAPFYATALEFAALYGVVAPYEGMKWIGHIEDAWHGYASYRSDIRRIKSSWHSMTLMEDFQAAREGAVIYLGYCMQKRGNIDDSVEGKRQYTIVSLEKSDGKQP